MRSEEEWNRIWIAINRIKIHDMTRLRIGHSKITHEYGLAKTEPPFCNIYIQQINHPTFAIWMQKISKSKKPIQIKLKHRFDFPET